ncbi:nuclear transport factor 2 family protein [Hyphomicrobium nitrativorans]|uniref:nuclear transport factor 2 family protein n=1 Tax=Hyphomicrobium nitrativorans TaxID=1427356 RepID=UPI00059CA260|nr:nuclear transport factor 2 family protein [Hyphomicrobium nitrativorans]
MPRDDNALVFRLACRYWNDGDFDSVIALLADDIRHTVNVDALGIPWMASAEGKADVAARLNLIRETFLVDAFVIEALVTDAEELRATVVGYHTHKKTRERLDVRLRFRVRVRDGLLAQIDETVDAAYFEAFERFVRYLEQTAEELGNAPPEPFSA